MSRTSTYVLVIFIGLGGALGSVLRYTMAHLFSTNIFPYGTLIVNILGCFILAFLSNHAFITKKLPKQVTIAINTGIIGSFTTFSTFTVETLTLITNNLFLGTTYVFASIIVGLLACVVGYLLAKKIPTDKESIQ
ncbi:fluoride efflux transporter CrcB [Paraliobacillus sp. JSM ZJ581]|uniref:fluoride efflux transporter CrcB n=1 Tax=Paraliobacillus sp. JSM ZJ581 TaxID=3342118 RepID=UPI0035A89CC6